MNLCLLSVIFEAKIQIYTNKAIRYSKMVSIKGNLLLSSSYYVRSLLTFNLALTTICQPDYYLLGCDKCIVSV